MGGGNRSTRKVPRSPPRICCPGFGVTGALLLGASRC